MLRFTSFAVVAAVVTVFVSAHEAIEIADQMRRELGFGLFPRLENNLQPFTGALGGAAAPAIQASGNSQRPFMVDGDTFTDFQSAASRACDNQHNTCANLANKGGQGFTVGQCDQQNTQCKSAATAATQTAFQAVVSSNAEFDFICDT